MVCPSHSTTAKAEITSFHSLHSALKEFFEPLRKGNPRADFFAVYRKESEEFDREYARKYDEDLNTTLIFVSPTCIPDVNFGGKHLSHPFIGWFVLGRQFRIYRRCTIQARTRPE